MDESNNLHEIKDIKSEPILTQGQKEFDHMFKIIFVGDAGNAFFHFRQWQVFRSQTTCLKQIYGGASHYRGRVQLLPHQSRKQKFETHDLGHCWPRKL